MTSSERRVTSGKVWNKEDDRREKSEKARGVDAGQEVDWFLALSPEDNLYSTSCSTIVSFVRSWAGSKARLFFFHLEHPSLVPAAPRVRRSFRLVRKSGTGRRGIVGSTGRDVSPLSHSSLFLLPPWTYETAHRETYPPTPRSLITRRRSRVAPSPWLWKRWLLHPDLDDQTRRRNSKTKGEKRERNLPKWSRSGFSDDAIASVAIIWYVNTSHPSNRGVRNVSREHVMHVHASLNIFEFSQYYKCRYL